MDYTAGYRYPHWAILKKMQDFLDDPKVSRVHCVLRYDSREQLFILKDVSSNGTFVSGRMIGQGNSVKLGNGDVFSIVSKIFEFRLGVE